MNNKTVELYVIPLKMFSRKPLIFLSHKTLRITQYTNEQVRIHIFLSCWQSLNIIFYVKYLTSCFYYEKTFTNVIHEL